MHHFLIARARLDDEIDTLEGWYAWVVNLPFRPMSV
jgi:hypothetical protein